MFNVIYFSKAPKDPCGKMLLARCYNLGERASDYSTGERPSGLTFAFTLRPDAVTPQRGSPNHPQPPPATSSSPTSPRPLLDFLQIWTSKMTVLSGTCLLCCPHIQLTALSTRSLSYSRRFPPPPSTYKALTHMLLGSPVCLPFLSSFIPSDQPTCFASPALPAARMILGAMSPAPSTRRAPPPGTLTGVVSVWAVLSRKPGM